MEYIKLNKLCDINIGKTPARKNNDYWGEGNKWLSISDLKEKYISKSKEEITDLAVKKSNMKLVPKNTVVMSFKLSIGKTAILKEDMYTNEAIANFQIKDKSLIIPEYLYYAIKTLNFDNTDRAVMGATLNKSKLNDIKIPYVNINTQRKIVEVLDKAQELIDKRKEQIEALDELVKSRFIEMFGDPVINSKGISEEALSKHLELIGGYAFKSSNFEEEGIPVLRIGNINSGYFKGDNLKFWKEDEKLEKYMLYPGDLVISLTGTVGKDDYANVCKIGNDYTKYYLNQRNAKIILKNTVSTEYITELLRNEGIKRRLTSSGKGIRQANISNKNILDLVVPIPPIELQNQFADFVKQTDKLKEDMEASLKELEDNFNSLMQKAFKGELFN